MILANKKGMSLLEVIMALGLLSMVSMGVLQLFAGMNSFLKSAENKSSELQLITEISQVASDKDLCKKAVTDGGAQSIDLASNFKLKLNIPGTGEVSQGKKIKNSLIIKEFYVDSFSTPVAAVNSGQKRVTGAIWLQTEDDKFKSVQRKKKNIGVINLIYDEASKEIVECFGSLISPKSNCESLGFTWDSAKQLCRQNPSQSCTDVGGVWNNSKCTIASIDPALVILNKSCSGANVALVGFDSSGNPKCQQIQVTQVVNNGGGTPPPAPTPTQATPPPAAATPTITFCPAGNQTIKSNDGKNTCVFSWDKTPVNNSISCSNGVWCSAGGGSLLAKCGTDGKYSFSFVCPDVGGGSCVGGMNTISSVDNTNSCLFHWAQGSNGSDISLITATNGGTADGKCINGAWSASFKCPGKGASCPGGYLTFNKCYFKYEAGAAGSQLSAYDLNGKGTISGIVCGGDGKWNNQNVKVTGCD